MTSLIDVIFLLLLFFMLSSTFSKYSEVELFSASAAAPGSDTPDLLWVRIEKGAVYLNDVETSLAALPAELRRMAGTGNVAVLLAAGDEVSSQDMVDVLQLLQAVPDVPVHLTGAS